jgi:hypothetical protein
MMPIVLLAMGIFKNYNLETLGVTFDANNVDLMALLLAIVSPMGQGAGFTILGYTFSISFVGTAIMGAVVTLLIIRNTAIQYIGAFFVAGLIIPFLLEIGYVFLMEAKTYGSQPTNLIIITIGTAMAALGMLTLIDMLSNKEDLNDT